MSKFTKDIQDIINSIKKKETSFDDEALRIYHYQNQHNPTYSKFHVLLGINASSIRSWIEIPCLPVRVFKNQLIKTGIWQEEVIFLSSGTGGAQSRHPIRHIQDYHENARIIFEDTFGPLRNYSILALLPNYMQNPASSLISMVNHFMTRSRDQSKGYYLTDYESLTSQLLHNRDSHIPTILFGVSFALLDFASKHEIADLSNTIIIETGGMKKQRREITRKEIHHQLASSFKNSQIHSEYGMTECTSQLYGDSSGYFYENDHIMVKITDPTDPLRTVKFGEKGRINICDLSNLHTISFIATDDIGEKTADGRIKIYGRLDNSDLRGCNYLI
jgi:hypothetical protein